MMNLKIYDDPKNFYERIKLGFFKKNLENELILGLSHFLINDPDHYGTKPFLATIEENEKLVLCAFMTPPWSILVYGIDTASDLPYQLLIEYLVNNKIAVPGVNGKSEISEKFANIWLNKNKCQKRIHMESRLYILKEVQPFTKASGNLIKADMNFLDLLIDWAKEFYIEVELDADETYIKNHVKFIIETGNGFIWIDEKPVCMVFCERPHEEGISVAYVYTPPELRKRGYATSCVGSVSQHALESGYSYCSLFADLANPTSNTIYQRVGYRPICDYIYYDFI
jgi:predicted GNAT family acetyltransferase